MTPLHILNLYQKPKLGTAFIKRLPVYNYRHSINAIGGFDTASCDIAVRSRDEGQQFLDQYLGNRVAFIVDNPVEPIWEGYINRMTFTAGGVQYTISLDSMFNRMSVQYITLATSATTPVKTTDFDETNSQAVYGIKEGTTDWGVHATVNTTTVAQLRDTIGNQRAWPRTSLTQGQGGGLLHIEMLGFFHTLEWENYNNASSAGVQLGNLIQTTLIATIANTTTFFDNADTTDITANTLLINTQKIRGESYWDAIQEAIAVGDASDNYWVGGVTPTLFSTGTRRFYYRPFSPTIAYTARQSDGLRIRNLYGQLVDPWRVQPDNGIRISDMLIGWNGVGDNPTETWIKSIDYDANAQSVKWAGDDDTTVEGVFQSKIFVKNTGKTYGPMRRLV
jgi:hypothetical protein